MILQTHQLESSIYQTITFSSKITHLPTDTERNLHISNEHYQLANKSFDTKIDISLWRYQVHEKTHVELPLRNLKTRINVVI